MAPHMTGSPCLTTQGTLHVGAQPPTPPETLTSGTHADTTPPPPQPPPQPPPPDMPAPTDRAMIILSNKENSTRFTAAHIIASLTQTARVLELPHADIFPQAGGNTGPYKVALHRELAEYLAADGETDLFVPDDDADPITFSVGLLDIHGRSANPEAVARVKERRMARQLEKTKSERDRTVVIFFTGSDEMLMQMHNEQAHEAAFEFAKKAVKEAAPQYAERIGFAAGVDNAIGTRTNELIAFVTYPAGRDFTTFVRDFRWPNLRFIKVSEGTGPITGRVTSATLTIIGAKNCCLKRYCIKDDSGRCAARAQFYKEQLRIRTMAPSDNTLGDIRRASKAAKVQGQAAERERLTGGEHLSQKTTRVCPRFLTGQCPRQSRDRTGTGRGRCQYVHDTDEVAATITCHFVSTGTACTNASCKYGHTPPQQNPTEDASHETPQAPASGDESTTRKVRATRMHNSSISHSYAKPDPRPQSHRIDDG